MLGELYLRFFANPHKDPSYTTYRYTFVLDKSRYILFLDGTYETILWTSNNDDDTVVESNSGQNKW